MGHAQLDVINTYLSAINPIACKITDDIKSTKYAYGVVWNDLTYQEQSEIVNQTLIQPEITLHYLKRNYSTSSCPASESMNEVNENCLDGSKKTYFYDKQQLDSFNRLDTGHKLIHDETIGVFRDEHSGPFSFKTKSQLNLTLFSNTQSKDSLETTAVSVAALHNNISTKAKLSAPSCSAMTEKQTRIRSSKENPVVDLKVPPSNLIESAGLEENSGGLDDEEMKIVNGLSKHFTEFAINAADKYRNGFLMRFICKDNMLFSTTNTTAATIDDNYRGSNYEFQRLVPNMEIERAISSSNTIQKSENVENTPNKQQHAAATYEESELLLNSSHFDLCKGFEFLSNW